MSLRTIVLTVFVLNTSLFGAGWLTMFYSEESVAERRMKGAEEITFLTLQGKTLLNVRGEALRELMEHFRVLKARNYPTKGLSTPFMIRYHPGHNQFWITGDQLVDVEHSFVEKLEEVMGKK
jgi:hypothetical protein